ncbi:MAG: hypothetical protein LBP22_13060 [Deltaproteobacteria bacterium]|nr:hypothetical protein [Deltaproteobacteria bacterium]
MAKQVNIKKLLRTEDAFLTTSERAYSFFLTHSRQIILAVVGLAALAGLILIISHVRASNLRVVAEQSSEALSVEDPGSSLLALNEILEKHPDSPASRAAILGLVELQTGTKDYAQAITNLEKFVGGLNQASSAERIISQLALGQLYEEVNNLDEAQKNYRTVQSLIRSEGGGLDPLERPLQSELAMSLARVMGKSGQTDQSRQGYETVLMMNPNRNTVQDIMARYALAQLGPVQAQAVSPVAPAANAASVSATPSANVSANAAADEAADASANAKAGGVPANVTSDNTSAGVTSDNASVNAADGNTSANVTSENASANVTSDNAAGADNVTKDDKTKTPVKPKPKASSRRRSNR